MGIERNGVGGIAIDAVEIAVRVVSESAPSVALAATELMLP
jgi:hypothetical protein